MHHPHPPPNPATTTPAVVEACSASTHRPTSKLTHAAPPAHLQVRRIVCPFVLPSCSHGKPPPKILNGCCFHHQPLPTLATAVCHMVPLHFFCILSRLNKQPLHSHAGQVLLEKVRLPGANVRLLSKCNPPLCMHLAVVCPLRTLLCWVGSRCTSEAEGKHDSSATDVAHMPK
ncbi:hypothetical protein KC19_VG070500 [Ceratodon purpureus]|uniref:Uncharacterized protein n=1 Tax=Ceratodon purpureus TaxID=3225 RepID=A0A8T0HMT6_CERPU|nr:hypothetical protein KC19_VG070500 [Ceratodon purpureus]